MNVADEQRHETNWEDLRLVVEDRLDHFQAFVYDPEHCEVLYTAACVSLDAAKFAAVDYAATARFGPHHNLRAEILTAMLVWDAVRVSGH